MKKLSVVLLLLFVEVSANCQDVEIPYPSPTVSLLTIGDPAPALRVNEWLKGKPIKKFEKGRVYVLEFWATWCRPCRAAMPHLSALARRFKNDVTVVGIDIYEGKSTTVKMVKDFVDSMAEKMDYSVVTEDKNWTVVDWFYTSWPQGIPSTFVINREGNIAWIGHPKDLEGVLQKIVDNTWDAKQALSERTHNEDLARLDDSMYLELTPYFGSEFYNDSGSPDLALSMIYNYTSKMPELKYAPRIAYVTFSSLLKMNPQQAYDYGKIAMVTPTYEEAPFEAIIGVITTLAGKLSLPPLIYRLGAEACQLKIDHVAYPEISNMHRYYSQMAEWYWIAGDKPKAISAQQKAVEASKNIEGLSLEEKKSFEDCLVQYKAM